MLRRTCLGLSTAALLVFSGCAAHPDPIIDTKGVNEAALALDWEECESYSEQVRIEQGAAKGAATGAVVGAVAVPATCAAGAKAVMGARLPVVP